MGSAVNATMTQRIDQGLKPSITHCDRPIEATLMTSILSYTYRVVWDFKVNFFLN